MSDPHDAAGGPPRDHAPAHAGHDPHPHDAYAPGLEQPERSRRPVSFYLAIFLGVLLALSAGLNLLLLVVSMFGSAAAGLAPLDEEDPSAYEVASIGGDSKASDRLLRIPIEGAIAEAASPLLGSKGGTVADVRRALRLARRDDSIRGVLLDINSPGGGVTDSDLIWREIEEFKRETRKPVLALLGDIAASGGYYVAAAADRILARQTTVTGSIGVIMSNLNFAEAARSIGVHQDVIVSERTPYKDIMSPFRAMTDDERAILRSIVDEMYDRFVDVVDRGRSGLTREQVVALADGRVYSAKQALAHGLVDGIATLDEAWTQLAELGQIGSARYVEQRRRPSLTDLLFGVHASTVSGDAALAALLQGSVGPHLLYWWPGGR
ncbi:MAG: signal peptide peptidase SppA [Planctomycetes bacterium]|nr:signal peptide peptidase SppA [Planctomycetota bacterium]